MLKGNAERMDIAIRGSIGAGAVDPLIECGDFRAQLLDFGAGAAALAGERGLRLLQEAQDALFNFAKFGLRGLNRGGLGL